MSDLISRQAAKSKAVYSPERHEKVVPVAELDWLPSVEPERKPGYWTHEDEGVWICGVCGEKVGEMGNEYGVPKYNFCPYCGVDMTGRG